MRTMLHWMALTLMMKRALLLYPREALSTVGFFQDYIRSPMLITTNLLLGISIKQGEIWNHSLSTTCPIGMFAEVGDDFGMRLIQAISEPVNTPFTRCYLLFVG